MLICGRNEVIEDVKQRIRMANLGKKELLHLRNYITFLISTPLSTENSNIEDESFDAKRMLELICKFLAKEGIEFTEAYQYAKIEGIKAFRDKVPSIMRYVNKASKKRTEQEDLISLGIKLLYEDLVDMKVAVSARTIIHQIHRLPAVINRAFPGYAQAELLGIAISKKVDLNASPD